MEQNLGTTPESAEAPITLEGLVEELGGNTTPPPTEEPQAPLELEEPVAPEEPTAPPEDKAAQAFAQMRVDNKKYQTLVKGIAEMLGVQDSSNPENITKALEQKILEDQSKKQGVPAEILQRLQELENLQQINVQERAREVAYIGFQKVKDEFNLTNADVEKFAGELQRVGINPFETPVDIVREYKLLNFDNIIEAAKQKAIEDEMKRSGKATTQGTTPNNKAGKGDTDAEKITTVAGLEKWMANNSK